MYQMLCRIRPDPGNTDIPQQKHALGSQNNSNGIKEGGMMARGRFLPCGINFLRHLRVPQYTPLHSYHTTLEKRTALRCSFYQLLDLFNQFFMHFERMVCFSIPWSQTHFIYYQSSETMCTQRPTVLCQRTLMALYNIGQHLLCLFFNI